jgi:hypothetical protein
VKILVATTPVDFRKGADGLVALVREQLRQDPFCGTILIFRSKRTDRFEDPGLGRVWTGAAVEAAGARGVPAAAGRFNGLQCIALGADRLQPPIEIEKSRLPHRSPPRQCHPSAD